MNRNDREESQRRSDFDVPRYLRARNDSRTVELARRLGFVPEEPPDDEDEEKPEKVPDFDSGVRGTAPVPPSPPDMNRRLRFAHDGIDRRL